MPSGCSDHRTLKPHRSPTDAFWCRTGSNAAAFAPFNDNIDVHDFDRHVHLLVVPLNEVHDAPGQG